MSIDWFLHFSVGALVLLTVYLSFSLSRKVGFLISFLVIVLFCIKESVTGILQLLGHCESSNYLYILTGSFNNPGPYGGFLTVCISLFAAYAIQKQEKYKESIQSKLLYYLVLIVSIVTTAILPLTQSRSALLALGISLSILALTNEGLSRKIMPYLRKYGLFVLVIVSLLVIGAYLLKKPSADGRFFIDKMCVKAMYENGWKGVGVGNFGKAYGETQANYFRKQIEEKGKDDTDWTAIDEHDRLTADCPKNAYNEFLFIGVEAGPIALLLFITMIVSAIIISIKRDTIWSYGLISYSVFALFSYPLHVKQLQLLFLVVLASCFADREKNLQITHNGINTQSLINKVRVMNNAIMIVSIVILSTTIALRYPQIKLQSQANEAWKKAKQWHQMGYYDYMVEDCDTLLPYFNNDCQFLFDYGQALNKVGKYMESDSVLKLGAKISCDPMFWNVMGNNSLALGDFREAERCYKHAFYMVPNRLYPLYLLTNLYHEEHDSASFLKMQDIAMHFVPKIESENTSQLRDLINELKLNEP